MTNILEHFVVSDGHVYGDTVNIASFIDDVTDIDTNTKF